MRGLHEGIIYRMVDRRHCQKRGCAGVEQLAFGMHEGHTVADGEGADTVHHAGTKTTNEGICHRYGGSRTAEYKCVFKHRKADTDQNGTFKQGAFLSVRLYFIKNSLCGRQFGMAVFLAKTAFMPKFNKYDWRFYKTVGK